MNEGAFIPGGQPPAPSITEIREQFENDKRAIEEYMAEAKQQHAHELRVLNQRIVAQAEVIAELHRRLDAAMAGPRGVL
jgi:hypothetical protein